MAAALEQGKLPAQPLRGDINTQLHQPLPMAAPGDAGVMGLWVLEVFGECAGGYQNARFAQLRVAVRVAPNYVRPLYW